MSATHDGLAILSLGRCLAVSMTLFISSNVFADDLDQPVNEPTASIELAFSDGRPTVYSIRAVNEVLSSVGVRVSPISPVPEAAPILAASRLAGLNADQYAKLLELYSLNRAALLDQIAKAGRKPETDGGGALSTQEEEIPPYPKVYDMLAMSHTDKLWALDKFSKLHVNSAANGVGVDELMSLVSGGPWTWFFLLPGSVTSKLMIGDIGPGAAGWRLSYPGLGPHGAFLNSDHGIVVAHVIGPKVWAMRYDDPDQKYSDMLGTNPWVDYSTNPPMLLNTISERSSR